METWFKSIPLYVIFPIVILIVILLVFLIIKAFYEGREISFWPPKIGSRPTSNDTSVNKLPKPTLEENSQEASIQKTIQTRNIQDYTRLSTVGLDFDPHTARKLGVISQTEYSTIEKCFWKGSNYVLKRTKEKFCQVETLRQLVGKNFTVHEKDSISATVATPIAVWVDCDYVWELHPYYVGISLLEIILRNKYKIRGKLLGAIYNCLVKAVWQMHEEGILHRDIAPSNILMTNSGGLVLLDCSFSCAMDSPQVPVGNSTYTPPEQLLGKACPQSDWYSLAATIFFLANGNTPEPQEEQTFKARLMNIQTGSYRLSPIFITRGTEEISAAMYEMVAPSGMPSALFEALLQTDAAHRPCAFNEIRLIGATAPSGGGGEIIGILDTGVFGYLVTQIYGFKILSKRELASVLNEALRRDEVDNNQELQEDIKDILQGQYTNILRSH